VRAFRSEDFWAFPNGHRVTNSPLPFQTSKDKNSQPQKQIVARLAAQPTHAQHWTPVLDSTNDDSILFRTLLSTLRVMDRAATITLDCVIMKLHWHFLFFSFEAGISLW